MARACGVWFTYISSRVSRRPSTHRVCDPILVSHGKAATRAARYTADIRPSRGASPVCPRRRRRPRVRTGHARRARRSARASRRYSHRAAAHSRPRGGHRRGGPVSRAPLPRSRCGVRRSRFHLASQRQSACTTLVFQAPVCRRRGRATAAAHALRGPHSVECGDALVRPCRLGSGGVPAHFAPGRADASEHPWTRHLEGARHCVVGGRRAASNAPVCRHACSGRRFGACRICRCRDGCTTRSTQDTRLLASVPDSESKRGLGGACGAAAGIDGRGDFPGCGRAIRNASRVRRRTSREPGIRVRSCVGARADPTESIRRASTNGLVSRIEAEFMIGADEIHPVSMGSLVARANEPAVALAAFFGER